MGGHRVLVTLVAVRALPSRAMLVPGGVERLRFIEAEVKAVGAEIGRVLAERLPALQRVRGHLELAKLPELLIGKLHLDGKQGGMDPPSEPATEARRRRRVKTCHAVPT